MSQDNSHPGTGVPAENPPDTAPPTSAQTHSAQPPHAPLNAAAPNREATSSAQPSAPPPSPPGDVAGSAPTAQHWWAPRPPEAQPETQAALSRQGSSPDQGFAPSQYPAAGAPQSPSYSAPTAQHTGYVSDPYVGAGDRSTGAHYAHGGAHAVPSHQSWTQAGSVPRGPAGPATAIGSPLFGQQGFADGIGSPGSGGASPSTPKRSTRGRGTLIASTVALALLAGFGGGALAANLNSDSAVPVSSALTSTGTAPTASSVTPAPTGSVQQVAGAILPSVVSVLSSSSSAEGEGSGVILSSDGQILTNNHVIEGATDLQVQFNDGTTAKATVVGADPVDDLAVIKAESVSGLTPATLGTSADLQVGQDVVAVGSPLGLSATVTSGIVSALNRPVATSDAQQQQPQQQQPQQQQLPGFGQQQDQGQTQTAPTATQSTVINAIQTDAAINPGNSGGPLVDMSGKVIGINSAIASLSSGASGESGSIGVGFAIPIDQAKRIAEEIIKTGKASHAVLGASVGDETVDGQALLTSGAKISQLTAGGGAEKAGLQVGDVITKVADQRVESADALVAAIRSAAPNSTVSVTYTRASDSKTVQITLGSSTE